MKKEDIKKIVSQDISKSKKMIALYNGGINIAEIAKIMGVRYNFVYNVVSNYCRMNDLKLRVVVRENKKEKIIELIKAGKTNVEISGDLKVSYNYVYSVRKNYELAAK